MHMLRLKGWKDKNCFMHHTYSESSSSFYEVQVTKLAGLSEWVIERARTLLVYLKQHLGIYPFAPMPRIKK